MSTQTTDWIVLKQAHNALQDAVAAVPADSWDAATPCSAWTVTQVFQHAIGDQLGYAAALTGSGGPSEDPFAPSGVLPADPVAVTAGATAASATAFAGVSADEQSVPNPLPQGPMPAHQVVAACALDAAIHAWDIAAALGRPSPLTAELATALAPTAHAIVEPLRAYGVYAAVVPAPEDEATGIDPAADLLRYLGRDPCWAARPARS